MKWLRSSVGASHLDLASRWVRIPSVAVPFADPTVTSVNEEFGSLALRDVSGNPNRFCLCVSARRDSGGSSGTYSPLAFVWNNMLVGHAGLV